jgi:hypothetical protein
MTAWAADVRRRRDRAARSQLKRGETCNALYWRNPILTMKGLSLETGCGGARTSAPSRFVAQHGGG